MNANGTEIEQDLKLRVVPFTATVRFLPLGHRDAVTPYIGAGVGIFACRYSESGEFLATDSSIFRGSSSAAARRPAGDSRRLPRAGRQLGPGLRDALSEREGELPSSRDFAGAKIDLGGFTYAFTVNVKF